MPLSYNLKGLLLQPLLKLFWEKLLSVEFIVKDSEGFIGVGLNVFTVFEGAGVELTGLESSLFCLDILLDLICQIEGW